MLAAAVMVYGPPGAVPTIATGWPTSRVVHWITTSLPSDTAHLLHRPRPECCMLRVGTGQAAGVAPWGRSVRQVAMAGVVGDEVGDGRAGADDLGRVPVRNVVCKVSAWTLRGPVLQPVIHRSLLHFSFDVKFHVRSARQNKLVS